MDYTISSNSQLAVLGGKPAFPAGESIPLIHPQGYGYKGEFSAVDAILRNEPNEESKARASQQRFVTKVLQGVEASSLGFRSQLQAQIGNFLELDPETISVICVTSGTNALRSVLKAVSAQQPIERVDNDEVIVPQTTVGATIEAVIAEGFKPVFVAVDHNSWLLDPRATRCAISDKTVAIITVDWLGTRINLEPFRKLAAEHQTSLISDSAQSFGAQSNRNHESLAVHMPTIYSLGYPKVFTGAGSGGVIVCDKRMAKVLERDSSGILRHEALAEANAFVCLRALEMLPKTLARRAAAGTMYRQLLSSIPGIKFQELGNGQGTNHYQMSFLIDAQAFRLSAKQLCQVLEAENVRCSAERMPCVATNSKFRPYGRIQGDVKHSQLLATNSITLPISNVISLTDIEKVCNLVKLAHQKAQQVLSIGRETPVMNTPLVIMRASMDIESKFHDCLIVPVLSKTSIHSKIIVSYDRLIEHSISIDELLAEFTARMQWKKGECVARNVFVKAVVDNDTLVMLTTKLTSGVSTATDKSIALAESGSSASVTLETCADGKLLVRKIAMGDGIDGNGTPWLRRQALFLSNSVAAKNTDLFVVHSKFEDQDNGGILELPYVASHSFGELVFANVGARHMVTATVDLLVRMSTSVWKEGQKKAADDYIQKAHFNRMRRRLQIARARDNVLDMILKQDIVTLNGEKLLGFEAVMKRLENHPMLERIQPASLSEIHGDLNIHNILTRLKSDSDEDVALIDPRGVPLLGDSDTKFECGDYGYDISKLLFSLTGFADIRKGFFNYSTDNVRHSLTFQPHPGSETMDVSSHLLIPKLKKDPRMRQWIATVEKNDIHSFELRVKLGEAAHFIADCACALGRNTPKEVVPLFLVGLKKLNKFADLLENSNGPRSINWESDHPLRESLGANKGATMIQDILFNQQISPCKPWPYDVLEVSIKAETAVTALKLLQGMVGTYLPTRTLVHLSTDPLKDNYLTDHRPPCIVLVHQANATRGQTHMLAAAARRTVSFFRDNGIAQCTIDSLRIVHISSTGSSSRSQFTARSNDKLTSPGIFGISPLTLAVMQSLQLPFPKPGRWIVENDSFFLLSQTLTMSGDHLCLLVMERPTSGSTSSWRVCLDECETTHCGLLVAKSFRNIQPEERGNKLLRTTTGMFVPHKLAEMLSRREHDYNTRISPLLIDLVLPRFMPLTSWIRLCHQQGYGVNSHLAWQNVEMFKTATSELVELANGGSKMAFYHFGSDPEYHRFLAAVSNDTCLNSLAYAGAAAQWLRDIELKEKTRQMNNKKEQ